MLGSTTLKTYVQWSGTAVCVPDVPKADTSDEVTLTLLLKDLLTSGGRSRSDAKLRYPNE